MKKNKIIEIQNYSRVNDLSEKFDHKIDNSVPNIIYVAQLIDRKGIGQLIESAKRVSANRDFVLTIIGDGPLFDSFVSQISGYEKFISFKSGVPYGNMREVYNNADGLIAPTLEDVWCLIINEAIQFKIPVMASIYAGGALDLLPPENRFDPLNDEAIDKALEMLIDKVVHEVNPNILWNAEKIVETIREAFNE
ncbi:glycosyltransferase [Deinococcus sp. LM3]|uniref:glycosyltransferase n=1 Tax=Deinococcus sp. LM3 TaxID=1938608 RepID=UPI001439EFA8|nr:glycosyltransferase [Deinococcus sp. LM3]